MNSYAHHEVRRMEEEGQCDWCGWPVLQGERAFTAEDGIRFFCSRTCRTQWDRHEADKRQEGEARTVEEVRRAARLPVIRP